MFIVTVTFVVKVDQLAAFLPLMQENAALSLDKEPGCLQFDVCQHPDKRNEVFLYEAYHNRDAFDAHLTMPHYLEFAQATEQMVTSKAEQFYRRIA